jgi:hypothetical protein
MDPRNAPPSRRRCTASLEDQYLSGVTDIAHSVSARSYSKAPSAIRRMADPQRCRLDLMWRPVVMGTATAQQGKGARW